jgi:hypothetical protein
VQHPGPAGGSGEADGAAAWETEGSGEADGAAPWAAEGSGEASCDQTHEPVAERVAAGQAARAGPEPSRSAPNM